MSAFKEWVNKSLGSLEKFGEVEEKLVYGDEIPDKPQLVAGQIVLPDAKEIDIESIAQIFAGDGYKGPGLNLGRVGDLFDKGLEENFDISTSDILNNIKEQNKELFEHARRKKLTIEDMVGLAERQGFNEISEKFLMRKAGDMMSAEDMVGAFLILRKLSQEIKHGAEQILNMPDFLSDTKVLSNSPGEGKLKLVDDFEKVQRMMQIYTHLSAQISGGASEAGRTLGVVSHIEKVLDVDARVLETEFRDMTAESIANMVDESAVQKIKYMMTNIADLDLRSQDAYIKLQYRLPKYTMNAMMEMYINALLSSPVTHMVNIAGNAVFQGTRFLETGLAGYIGDARTFVRDKLGIKNPPSDRAMHVESEAFVYGSLMAQKEAFMLMAKTALTGKSSDLKSKLDIDDFGIGTTNSVIDVAREVSEGKYGRAFINTMGIATRLPGRFLAMEDEYFKVMIRRRVQYQEAFRKQAIAYQKALKVGMKPKEAEELAKKAYMKEMTNPTQATLQLMKDTSLQETFQSPIEGGKIAQGGNMLFNNYYAKVLGIPFYKTPMNIFKEVGDRTINIFPVARALRKQISGQGGGRDFDVAMSKLVTGWGIMTTAIALTRGVYGDNIIITGTGPGNRKARDVINKGANIPSTSIGVKQNDGSYKFYSFNRFDPLSMLLVASADYNNFAEYNPDSPELEKLANILTLVATEYASSIPFMQGFAEFTNMVGDRYNSGDNAGARIMKWLGSRSGSFLTNVGGQAETLTSLGAGSLMRKVGIDYPFIGSTSFTATLERVSDPFASNTMLTPDQVMGQRIEEINPFWRGWLEALNKARARHPLYSIDMARKVNFWNEDITQLDPEQLRKNGKLIQSFNPLRIQTGEYTPLDEELMRLSRTGIGTFSNHQQYLVKDQDSYRMTDQEYNKYVYNINYVDDEGKLPGDIGYNSSKALLPSLNDVVFGGKSLESQQYNRGSDDERFEILETILSNRRSEARDLMFKGGRLQRVWSLSQ